MRRTTTALCALAAAWMPLADASARSVAEALQIEDTAFGLGTLTEADGALGGELWDGADPQALAGVLAGLPRSYAEPAYLDLARRVLLSPATAPDGADDALAGAKLRAAAELGFYRDAGELAELAPQLSAQPDLTKVAALSALLDGDVRRACTRGARLTQGRADPFFLQLRYLCYVDAGEESAADLTLGLLTDQGLLSEGAERVFTALQTSGDLGGSVSPEDAFQYAAIQMLGAEVSVAAVPELPGSVLAAVARDAKAPSELRLPALERALAVGLIGPSEGQGLAAEMAETPLAAEVVAVATERAGSPEMAAAAARSLGEATSYDGFRARAALFRDAARTGPGPDQASVPYAGTLALAAIVNGDLEAGRAWTGAMAASGEAEARRKAALSELSDLAEGRARVVAVPLSDPLAEGGPDVAGLTAQALATARGGSKGAAALVALAGLGVAAEGEAEAVREAIVLSMLEQSGMAGEVARRVALEAEAAAIFAGGADDEFADADPVPRLKPDEQ